MDSDKLQKLANLAIVRQHAAAVTASTNFPRKYINDVSKTLGALDTEFINTLISLVGDVSAEDTQTIAQRLAEEKAKLKAKSDPAVSEPGVESQVVKSEVRPTIKTARAKKDK